MRIVIDLQGIQSVSSRSRGIGRYAMALSRAMAKNAGDHEIWLVLNRAFDDSISSIRKAFDGLVPADRIRTFSAPTGLGAAGLANVWRVRAAELLREAFLADLRPDVVLVSSLFEGLADGSVTSVGLLGPDLATAVTLYDLLPHLHRDSYLADPGIRPWYERKIESLTRAQLLLTVSEFARQEARDALNLAKHQVVNISAGISARFKPVPLGHAELQGLLTRYELNRPFIMCSGAFAPRKNLDRLIKAFALLPGDIRDGHCLLLVGKASTADQGRLLALAEKLGVGSQLRLAGYVQDEELVSLYSHCAIFVFPSLDECFGRPALEAMACGAATIGSNSSSIPEVIDFPDALFDPTDQQAIAAKIEEVLTDDNLHRRLCEHAPLQAAKFSWDASARRALAAFEQLFDAKPSLSPDQEAAGYKGRYQKLISSLARLPGKPAKHDLQEVAMAIDRNRSQTELFRPGQNLPASICWRLEGPFDSSYSLALLNRETARALAARGHEVSLHSTEGPGDFPPKPNFLKANPDIAAMHALSLKIPPERCQVVSRNLYPPRVADMTAPFNLLHHYAWEESGFPSEWVKSFNENLQGITCLSQHVQKILIDHGVSIPLATSGCGVDHWLRIKPAEDFHLEARTFRFLHVSSCFPRKGVNLLLEAYGQAFTALDDVSLVIKTFVNPHNDIQQLLAAHRQARTDFPDVVVIEDDLSDSKLKNLYSQCHCLVAPSRAEGFGLPLAEAMLSGLPVITTAWGGQMDFCSEETAWLIDYTFVPAATHFNLHDSVWAEPDLGQLAQTMREVYEMGEAERNQRVNRGRALLLKSFRWEDVARRLERAVRDWSAKPALPSPRVGWVTTWNTRCGVATYSAHLLDNMPLKATILACHTAETVAADGPEVERCWAINGNAILGDNLDNLARVVNEHKLDILVIQFNYSFFHLAYLARFIEAQIAAGRILVFMMHSTVDRPELPQGVLAPLVPALKKCQRICVHSVDDLNRLKKLGLVDNVTLFPHGILDYSSPTVAHPPRFDQPLTIASYGFFLPHKGLLELIEAVNVMIRAGENVQLLMVNAEYPVSESRELIEQAHKKIRELGLGEKVRVISDFLDDKASLDLLAEADIIVYPYQKTAESASGAVRYGLAVGRPVAVSPIAIFDDVGPVVSFLPGNSPEALAKGLKQLFGEIKANTPAIRHKLTEAERWRATHRYSHLGHRLYAMLCALHNRGQ